MNNPEIVKLVRIEAPAHKDSAPPPPPPSPLSALLGLGVIHELELILLSSEIVNY